MKQHEVQACFIAHVISDLRYFIFKLWILLKMTMFYQMKCFLLNIPLSALNLVRHALTHVHFTFIYFFWKVMIL